MTTQLAFAFGMLSMVAITMLVAIVVGMVKVIRLQREMKNLQQVLGHEIHMAQRTIYEDVYETRRNFDERLDNLHRELTAYTDSRIDKSIVTKEKQLLKS